MQGVNPYSLADFLEREIEDIEWYLDRFYKDPRHKDPSNRTALNEAIERKGKISGYKIVLEALERGDFSE